MREREEGREEGREGESRKEREREGKREGESRKYIVRSFVGRVALYLSALANCFPVLESLALKVR